LAQIIKNRRGPIGNLKAATANNGEVIVASGSISDLSGPFVFIGSPNPSDNGSAGAFKAVSKIYTGTNAPTISNVAYGTTLDGTPFYSTNSQSLYILNNDGSGNSELDLTGNIEGNSITSVSISEIDSTLHVTGDLTASNLRLTGNADIVGDITLGGSITLGNADVDFINFEGEISSSLIPDVDGAFDIGSPTKEWANIYVETLNTSGSNIDGNVQITGTLDVDGQTTLASVNVEDLTSGRVVLAGASGELTDDGGLTYNTSTDTLTVAGDVAINGGDLTSNQATFNLLNSTPTTVNAFGNASAVGIGAVGSLTTFGGDVRINGNDIQSSTGATAITLIGNNVSFTNDVFISGSLTLLGDATSLIVSSSTIELDDNIIRLNAYAPFQRYAGFEVIDSGSSGVSASLQWDSQNDYWLIESSSKQSGKVIATTYGTFGSETSLTTNTIPKATGDAAIGNSKLTDDGSNLIYDTDALNVAATSGNTSVKGIVTLTNAGGTDGGSNGSGVVFRNSSNQLGYVSTTETTDVLDGILGYKNADGALVFSTVIDGGTF